MFIDARLLYAAAITLCMSYVAIGCFHLILDGGTNNRGRGRLRYVFFWPYYWLHVIVTSLWAKLTGRKPAP